MIVRRSFYRAASPFFSYSGPFRYPDGDGGGAGDGDGGGDNAGAGNDAANQNADPLDGLTDAQRKAIESRIAAARKDGEKTGRTKAETALEESKRLAKEEADRQKLIDAGKYEEAEAKLKGDLTAVSGEKETLAAQVAEALNVITPLVESLRKELTDIKPEAVKDEPKDLSPLQALKWLQDRKTLIAALGIDKTEVTKYAQTPRSNANGKQELTSPLAKGQILNG